MFEKVFFCGVMRALKAFIARNESLFEKRRVDRGSFQCETDKVDSLQRV